MLTRLNPYRKAFIAFALAAATWAATALADSSVSPAEWFGLGAAILTCAGVYAVPNEPVTA